MSRYVLPCPFRECRSIVRSFALPSQLGNHLHLAHNDRVNQMVDAIEFSQIFRPSWSLVRPQPVKPPPLLHSVPGYAALATTSPAVILNFRMGTPTLTPSQWTQVSQTPSRKRPKMRLLSDASAEPVPTDEDEPSYVFANLRRLSDYSGSLSDLYMVWRRPPQFDRDVSRPGPTIEPSVLDSTPPQSILHPILKQKLPLDIEDEVVRSG